MLAARRRFKCKACHHQFSVTSGTIFASRKLAFVDLLGAIAVLVNGAKGVSALQLSRCAGLSYKTAFVLAHKIREALASETEGLVLEGAVEIDGAYVGGHLRPANARTDRVDRRLRVHRGGDRRSVVAIRQRDGRTLTDVFQNEAEAVRFARSKVAAGSKLVADETPHWDQLASDFDLCFSTITMSLRRAAWRSAWVTFEDDGIAQSRVCRVKITGAHHPLGEGAGRHLGTLLKLQGAEVSDLTFPEETVDDVACALILDVGEQSQRYVDMRQIVFGLPDLRLVRRDPTVGLSALASQRSDHLPCQHQSTLQTRPQSCALAP